MSPSTRTITLRAAIVAALLSFGAGIYLAVLYFYPPKEIAVSSTAKAAEEATKTAAPAPDSIELSDTQLKSVKVETVATREFPVEKSAVGSIDFNEEMLTQVFTPYQGRIVGLFAKVGDEVEKGKTLFTIDSPDLVQAASTLISAAGVLDLTNRTLERLKMLFATRAVSQKDLEQATSDQQTAQGAFAPRATRCGCSAKPRPTSTRWSPTATVDPILVVPSPISGRITARNASPGLFVQPGNPPPPFVVADISTMWMLANVAESDSPAFKLGQEVRVVGDGLSGPAYSQDIYDHRVERRPELPTACWCVPKSTIPSINCARECSRAS